MSDKQNILFIINPISGIGKKNLIPKAILKHLNLDLYNYDIQYTTHKRHGHEIAQTEKENYNIIVATGGDGTVSEIGTALIGSECALGIIPCGSGNGIARHLKIPLSLKKAVKQLNANKVIKIDTGTVNDIPFIGTCGFGFDAHIAKKFDEFHKRGFSSYIKLVKREYNSFEDLNYTIDGTYFKTAMMCCIANSSQFGNGFTISPDSKINDGQFELVFIDRVKYPQVPKLVQQFFSNKINKSPYFNLLIKDQNFTIQVENIEESAFHIDGEPFLGTSTFNIQILPQSLKVIY